MKPKGKVFDHFIENITNIKTSYMCTFCKTIYNFKNATKFAIHLSKCKMCPEDVKEAFKKHSKQSLKTTPDDVEPSTSQTSYSAVLNYNEINIHQAFAKAVYVTGTPLNLLEHPLWTEALKMLNPVYHPPSRKQLATTLLEQEYSKVKKTIQQQIHQSKTLHLCIDGWSNLRNESILNVIICTPKPYFYKFINTKGNRHTAEYLLKEISEVLDEVGAENFLGVVSDNASNMARCGALLENKYKHIKWVGCLAHTLQLWIGDILKIPKVRKLFSCTVEVIKTIKHSHLLCAMYKKVAEEEGVATMLHIPVKTRWGSYLFCLESFLKSKSVIQHIVINSDNLVLKRHENILLDEGTWHELQELQQFLKPIVDWIKNLEGDYSTIHLVHRALCELGESLNNPLTMMLLEDDFDILKHKFCDRKSNALKPIHYAATILDPKNLGKSLNVDENLEGCEIIINTDTNNAEIIFRELSNYKNHSGFWEKEFIWSMVKTVEPIAWWESLFPETLLGKAALKILTLPASSASVERSFSTFSNIHTTKRNRLQTDRAGKICYLSHNWKLLNRHVTKSTSSDIDLSVSTDINQDESSDSEDDFCDISTDLNINEELAAEDSQNEGIEQDPLNIDDN